MPCYCHSATRPIYECGNLGGRGEGSNQTRTNGGTAGKGGNGGNGGAIGVAGTAGQAKSGYAGGAAGAAGISIAGTSRIPAGFSWGLTTGPTQL